MSTDFDPAESILSDSAEYSVSTIAQCRRGAEIRDLDAAATRTNSIVSRYQATQACDTRDIIHNGRLKLMIPG